MLQPKNQYIRYEVDNDICHMILNNPPSNLMNEKLSVELSDLLDKIDISSLKGMIVRGAERHFSAGAEVERLAERVEGERLAARAAKSSTEDKFRMSRDSRSFKKIADFQIPVVAAIRGVCLGSGFELALACHYRICDKRAVMGLVESTFDLMPGCGGTLRLPKIVGRAKALELILKGDMFSSEEALTYKIVNEVVPHRELLTRAANYVKQLSPYYRARYKNDRTQAGNKKL